MKKTLCLFISLLLLMSIAVFPVEATSITPASTEIQYLQDGSYYVIEIADSSNARSSTRTVTKSATYYTANNVAVFKLSLTGYFSYEYGVSASATDATCTVTRYKTDATIIAQNAYTSGKTAYAYTGIDYLGNTLYKEVTLTCDIYGNVT